MALNNIGNMMKIMNAWNIFKRNHPKFPAFCNAVSKRALKEATSWRSRLPHRMAKRLRRI